MLINIVKLSFPLKSWEPSLAATISFAHWPKGNFCYCNHSRGNIQVGGVFASQPWKDRNSGIWEMDTLPMPSIPDEEETMGHFDKATTNFHPASDEMKSDEGRKVSDEMMFEMFSSFMARIAELDELVDAAYRFLVGFQQALEFIKRPSIDMSHAVLEHLITANSTRQLSSYIEAGCFSPCDIKESISKLHTCHLGLLDHKIKAKNVVKELESILDNAEEAVRADLEDLHRSQDNNDVTDYAILMTSVFWMVKKDYKMQEKVVSALSLKSSSEELESYCLMWSLRPFVDNEIIEKAWRYVR